MRIYLESNPSNAPGCVLIVAESGQDRLIQTDWDWPCIASTFGFNLSFYQQAGKPSCPHAGTDGTINCPDCGMKASQFISLARQWLDEHDGAEAEDPGYFDDN